VSSQIHKFLLAVCTDPEKGVLLPDSGWYPRGSTPDIIPTNDSETIGLGLDSPVYLEKSTESIPIRNGNLSDMIQRLRPDTDLMQMELLLKVFRAAPELVYDYFSKRTMFASEPKPSPAWLGESAFLFSTVQLPVPANCGWKDSVPAVPPPVSVVIENVLPRPLTQKMVTRCMYQNTDVVSLFAIRVSTLALRKLQAVLKIFRAERTTGQELWSQAEAKLVEEFSRRCPTMKDTILAFRQTPGDNLDQQEAILELLATFYEVLADVAFETKFDVSLTLLQVLKSLESPDVPEEHKDSLFNQLEHLSLIAHESPALRWWQKPGE
jgi:nucleolar pre-ribosomal-associated protein 1